jgi:hypothetical protein
MRRDTSGIKKPATRFAVSGFVPTNATPVCRYMDAVLNFDQVKRGSYPETTAPTDLSSANVLKACSSCTSCVLRLGVYVYTPSILRMHVSIYMHMHAHVLGT